MRKLAREAVIFMLLTPIVVFVSSFIYLYHDAHKSVAVGLSAGTGTVPAVPNSSLPPITAEAMKTFQPIPAAPNPQSLLRPGETPGTPVAAATTPIPPGFMYPVTPPTPILELLGDSLLFGLYGFPVGFGFWAFYRVVRFAIKG